MRPDSLMKVVTPCNEYCWAVSTGNDTARLLSIPMYDTMYGFGDIVRFTKRDDEIYGVVELVEKGKVSTHIIRGPEATPGQSMALMERLREVDLRIEVWSLSLKPAPPSLSAGMIVPVEMDALEAYLRLRRASQQAGVIVSAPTLAAAAGDEVGVARDKRLLRLLGRAA